jgi:hypothetical protein
MSWKKTICEHLTRMPNFASVVQESFDRLTSRVRHEDVDAPGLVG